ncbi:EAL domain-containing protein [Fulvimarina sp. MAC3]|uniref:EAL domain-containing protein n=1 Tax=Fulvimarina sp. MAC3 TaxID=3148887 RepID=UPI0031FC3797
MRNAVPVLAPSVALVFIADTAHAQAGEIAGGGVDARLIGLATALDTTWVLIAASLVLFMQTGFMMIEAGSVRTKNAVSVAQKNLLDIAFATMAFAGIGYMLAFGMSYPNGYVGWDKGLIFLNAIAPKDIAFFIFQVMFCGTAATIISGAVAERMGLRAYILLCVILAGVIYPVFAHWAWGAALGDSPGAFLANAGFVDFAGSTVVHATGGWMALASIIVLGARAGRFEGDCPVRFGCHSTVLSSAGALILFVGWIGFNGGSTLAASPEVPGIILNTILAGAAGGVVSYGTAWWRGALRPDRAINGMIGGLVAITAGCHLVGPDGALLLGALGGSAANLANRTIEKHFQLDDAVGAVGAHGVAGVVGTIGLVFVAPEALLPAGSRLDQFYIQAAGVGLNFVWAFGCGLILILLVDGLMRVRVSAADEALGLNESEHGVRLGTGNLEFALDSLTRSVSDKALRVPVQAGDDSEDLARRLNALMDRLQKSESERRKLSETARNRHEAERFAALGEITAETILLFHEGRVRRVNPAAEALFGANSEALSGRTVEQLAQTNGLDRLGEWLEASDGTSSETTLRADDGRSVSVEVRVRTTHFEGRQVSIVSILDLSEKIAARERIFHLALHDTLTDLPNRELFNRRLGEALGDPDGLTASALLLVDIDKFKDINDIHGHPSGDAVLVAVAERLKTCVRKGDTVARLGGDEFAIIQTGLSFPAQTADLAHRALAAISQPLTLPTGAIIQPRASIGVTVFPRDGVTAETLLQNADLALYAVKDEGRNGFKLFEEKMGQAQRMRQELETDLAQAIERGDFELYVQPRVDLKAGRIASYEALLRWRRGDSFVSPADFIPIAEASGQIVELGEWVFAEACRIASEELTDTAISVNVSPRQFLDPNLVPMIQRNLKASGLDPARLEIEITEGVLIDDDRRALRILGELRALGLRFALDDFGTGYSSLSYLTRFNFDTIKIDKSFVQSTEEKAWHVISSVIAMSRGLKASVVAEGIETEEHLLRLAREGCTEVQGFLIARPSPVCEAMRELPPELCLALLGRSGGERREAVSA